jgi:FkbM family methyltransferase
VHAVEPLADCRAAMARRLSEELPHLKGVVELHACAIGRADGAGEFQAAVDLPGFSGLKKRNYPKESRTVAVAVEIRSLDSLFGGAPRIDYLKLDAEGGEFDILEGAQGILAKHRPLVSFESGLSTMPFYGTTPAMMAAIWQRLGYRVADIHGRELNRKKLEKSLTVELVWDYFAAPAEKPELFEAAAGVLRFHAARDRPGEAAARRRGWLGERS